MKKWLLYISIFIVFLPQSSIATEWEIPPIPRPATPQKTIMIFSTKDIPKKSSILREISTFRTIKLRYLFTEAFTGFSVEGDKSELAFFEKNYRQVAATYEANTYQTEWIGRTNNQLIGTELARGIFDDKGNRLTGKGVKIGVIDTGIDYHHADLMRSYRGGYDFVDGDHMPMEAEGGKGTTIHGTHVSGIIAANGEMQGVAPEAELYSYRVLGPGGTGKTDQVLAAIDQSIKDRMDIINLSLGSNINGPDLPVSIALNKAVAKGVVAVASNGNSGPNMWTVGSPGTASKAISVGASTPELMKPYLSIPNLKPNIQLNPLLGSKEWKVDRSFLLTDGGSGRRPELKNSFGKIVLIKRGELTFTEKVKNAANAGAVGVIIVNNTEGPFEGMIDEDCSIPAAALPKKVGDNILQKINQTHVIATIHLKNQKDLLADFSSRGPVTVTWSIKPDVTAPGVAIKSTIPKGRYADLQGTSMAAPFVAGAAALIKQAHPFWKPEEIKAALMNTAQPLVDENKKRYRVYEQGAGRIQIEKAIHTKSLVSPASLSFGMVNRGMTSITKNVQVKNISDKVQHYHFNIVNNNENLRWELTQSFSLKPGEMKNLPIKCVVKGFAKEGTSILDGQLELEAGSQKIGIPYLAVINEPQYPRIMGFSIVSGDKKGYVRYEAYIPMGADEFGIALFDTETMSFLGFLDIKEKVGAGMLKNQTRLPDIYNLKKVTAVAFAKKMGKEDYEVISFSK